MYVLYHGQINMTVEVISSTKTVQSNKKQCKEIAALASEIVAGLVIELDGVDESQLDDPLRLTLTGLEWCENHAQVRRCLASSRLPMHLRKLERIRAAMQHLKKRSFLRRLVSKDDDAKSLSEHCQSLQNALVIFQVSPYSRGSCCPLTTIARCR